MPHKAFKPLDTELFMVVWKHEYLCSIGYLVDLR